MSPAGRRAIRRFSALKKPKRKKEIRCEKYSMCHIAGYSDIYPDLGKDYIREGARINRKEDRGVPHDPESAGGGG